MRTDVFDGTLRLTNDGKLELFFLGTGSAFVKKNYQNNLLVIKGDTSLLIDCGTRCPEAFVKYNSSVANVKTLLITHSHADHIGGVEEIALTHRYMLRNRADIVITDIYKKKLWNESPKGGLAYGERHETPYNKHTEDKFLTFDDYFNQITPTLLSINPRPIFQVQLGTLDVKMFATMHQPEQAESWKDSAWSTGVLLDDRVLFTGDTRFDPDLLNWITGTFEIETIFHDCQPFPGGVHANLAQLETLSPDIKKKMYICHYGDNFTNDKIDGMGFAGLAQPGIYYCYD